MTTARVPNYREPLWRPHPRVPRSRVPAALRPWLLDTGSLTERICTACSGSFRVDVLNQRWARPMRNEARLLGLKPQAYARIREVRLLCAGVPWVYARTIIPPATLSGPERRLAHLGSRSLGAALFADPSVIRGEIELACLREDDLLYQHATEALGAWPDALWGRRARFTLQGKELLVSEVFLPSLGAFPA